MKKSNVKLIPCNKKPGDKTPSKIQWNNSTENKPLKHNYSHIIQYHKSQVTTSKCMFFPDQVECME